MVGGDIVLPCQLEPPVDAVSMTMELGRPDLEPRFVYVWHDGQELLTDQNQAYKGRVLLSNDRLKLGDLSLNLYKVTISDNGRYRCFIPKLNKEYFLELLVGSVSSPGINLSGIHKANSAVMLDCRSKGWYPEPEVVWLDGEGNLLSAGPTETVRGPDDLYTVSSRVTVEKRHSNNFTCRVQQKDINQTRETHIYVPENFFMATSNCAASIAFSVLFGFMFVLARKQEHQQLHMNTDRLMKSTMDEVKRITERKEKVEKHMEKIKNQMEDIEKQREEIESKLQSKRGGRLL
ncbi:butyrophilin subfamily 2 member A2-like [Dicentrarchus labrax]|uniref:butyrophilin subfamily 2 member A2-like n=1 Tax=Dicentrarchus labrax TaxID=13489 RepID=UPI0021F5195C|nr:butyrophilin subfamily 2 member A2-like [Dicentrarchus labrax]